MPSYTQQIKYIFLLTLLIAFALWNFLIAFVSRYKQVYVLVQLLMGDEASRVNHHLGFISARTFPWWLGWYKNLIQLKHFMFQGKLIRSLPFTEIQHIYFRERTIIVAISCLSLIVWAYTFIYFLGKI